MKEIINKLISNCIKIASVALALPLMYGCVVHDHDHHHHHHHKPAPKPVVVHHHHKPAPKTVVVHHHHKPAPKPVRKSGKSGKPHNHQSNQKGRPASR